MRRLLVLLAMVPALAHAQVAYPPTDAQARADAQAALEAASGAVKSVNGVTPTGGNITVAIPTASTTLPPSVSDTGTVGNMTNVYALANHTHASKARKGRLLVPASGTADVTFSSPFATPPLCVVVAETAPGDTSVVNAQIDGPTTATGFRIRITRTNVSVVALLGLSVLSVPTQVATNAHYLCLEL